MERDTMIIGGNSGIGLEIVKQLVQRGDRVHAASRSNDQLQDFSEVSHQTYDVTDTNAELQVPEKLDGFVYCPGTINLKPFHRLKDEEFQGDLDVNFLGAVRTLRMALDPLKQSEHASVVLFSTVAVETGLPFHAAIASAKGAVEGLARTLAAELAPGIRVNCLALSLTDTPLGSKFLSSDDKVEAANKRHPLGRVGDAGEVAKAAAFLLGEESGFITGQVMKIDGGISGLRLL